MSLTPTRDAINACLRRLEAREHRALVAARLAQGRQLLPRPELRSQIRSWFWERKAFFWKELAKMEFDK